MTALDRKPLDPKYAPYVQRLREQVDRDVALFRQCEAARRDEVRAIVREELAARFGPVERSSAGDGQSDPVDRLGGGCVDHRHLGGGEPVMRRPGAGLEHDRLGHVEMFGVPGDGGQDLNENGLKGDDPAQQVKLQWSWFRHLIPRWLSRLRR